MIELKKPYEETIGIDKLYLDTQNYRIAFDKYKAREQRIDRLYAEEDVMGIMKDIVGFKGLFPNEKLIVTPNEDHTTYTVKEGNRRVLAIQSLLNMVEPPSKCKSKVFELASKLDDETKESLKHIGCVVYDPNDNTVNRIIVNKHSTTGYKKWGQIGQWHKDKDLYNQYNKNIDKAAEQLGIPKQNLSNYIRYYNLITYIRTLPFWAKNDLTYEIDDNNLKATKFTRLIDSPDIKQALRLDYDETLEVEPPDEDIELFNFLLCKYSVATLLSDKYDSDYIDTRTKKDKVMERIIRWKKEYYHSPWDEPKNEDNPSQNKDENTSPSSTKDTGKGTTQDTQNNKQAKKEPDEYFENLTCYVKDQRLSRLTIELSELSKHNRIHKFPLAASMLTRAILESSLRYQLDKQKMFDEYGTRFKADHLADLIRYVKKNAKSLFDASTAYQIENALEIFLNRVELSYLNSLVHGNFIDPTSDHIHNIAGDIRELLQAILSGAHDRKV